MRHFGLILFLVLVAVGCNADPRCRRETALLRAEILDLEDKLALATAGSPYDGEILSSSNGIIISEPIIQSDGSTQIIYDSAPTHSSNPILHATAPLEVQHQIFPDEATRSPIIQGQTQRGSDELQIDIETPSLPSSTAPIMPGLDRINSPAVPDLSTPTPKDTGSSYQPTRTLEKKNSSPEIEIGLNGLVDAPDLTIENESKSQVSRIIVNRDASVGQNVDGRQGDEGLNLLVQPKTDSGTVLLETGELSVDLIDPTNDRTVGHWEFMPAETELFFASDREQGQGILLHLPWDQNLPTTQNLIASVVFVTTDGRRLTATSRLRVDPPVADYSVDDPQVARWTQRDTRWEIGSHNQSAASDRSRWTRNRQQRSGSSTKFVDAEADGQNFNGSVQRSRVKAIPASSSRPATQLPRWRPVR